MGAFEFDVVLACDNALPHLLDDGDLRLALVNVAAKLRPGGLFLASLRDYDRIVQERPRSEGPRVFDDPARRIAFQVWDWAADGQTYRLHQFILQRDRESWRTDHPEENLPPPLQCLQSWSRQGPLGTGPGVGATPASPLEFGSFRGGLGEGGGRW